MEQWKGFKEWIWQERINVKDFIRSNYTEYKGDDSFLKGTTEATIKNIIYVLDYLK